MLSFHGGISTILKTLQHCVARCVFVVGIPAAFIYEHVTCNVNSTDLTVNNARKHADPLPPPSKYMFISVYKIQSRRMYGSLSDG